MFNILYYYVVIVSVCLLLFFITLVISYFILITFPHSKVGNFVRSHIITDEDLEL